MTALFCLIGMIALAFVAGCLASIVINAEE